MKKKIFVIACIGIFATFGIIAGIVNYTDSNADEDKDIKDTKAQAVSIEAGQGVNDDKKMENSKEQKEGTDAKGTSALKENNTKAKGQTGTAVKNSSSNKTSDSKSANKEPSKPSHQHSWIPVYQTRQVPHIKQVPWTKCYSCGADMTGNPGHIDQHLLNGDSNVHYGTEYRSETYYTSEQYVSGYKCSCGAAK